MEPATTTPVPKPAFHSDDLEQVAEYRTMSSLAIVSLLFGLASPLCFIMPLLMAIPLFGAAISIVALRRIAASDGALAGRWAAATGLVLCVASAAAAITHNQVTRYLRTRQAEMFAQEWIGLLLAGKTDQAFRLTLTGARPAQPAAPGEPTPTESPLEHFIHHSLISALAGSGPESSVRFDDTLSYDPRDSSHLFVVQRFTITPAASAGTKSTPDPIEATLTLQRSKLPGERAARWLVMSHKAPGPSDANTAIP